MLYLPRRGTRCPAFLLSYGGVRRQERALRLPPMHGFMEADCAPHRQMPQMPRAGELRFAPRFYAAMCCMQEGML